MAHSISALKLLTTTQDSHFQHTSHLEQKGASANGLYDCLMSDRLGLNVSISGRSALFVFVAVHPGSLSAGDSALEDRL